MVEKYQIQIKCKNCKNTKWFTLDAGTLVKNFINQTNCEYCECLLNGKEE
ncbi:MAG: hypothetical protein AABY22_23845 [Nanoarchaeota archaeon]